MKKLLLIAAASATILSSTLSFADCAMDTSNENQWYVKVNAGATMFDKATDKVTSLKMKPKNAGFIGSIGAGYNVMDNLRADVTLGMVSNAQLKKSNSNVSVKHKPTITTLLLNGYVDFVDVGAFKVFGGAGIGTASLKDKITYTYAGNAPFSISTKQTYNFAWQVSLGASAEVAEGVKAELVYMYADNGKSKSKTIVGTNLQTGSTRYKGSNVMAGVRFDI